MKNFFNILFYISLIFLGIYLYKFNYFTIPKIYNFNYFAVSTLLLFAGFIVQAYTWKRTLQLYDIYIVNKLAISSSGLSIFMKYIPGKIMVVLGRAAYVSSKMNVPISKTTTSSFLNQIIILWTGLFLGGIILFTINIPHIWNIISILVFLFLTLILIFNKYFFSILKKLLIKLGKNLTIEEFKIKDVINICPSSFLNWIFWSIGFYLLIKSAYFGDVSLFLIFAFPLSATLAIIVLFAPGGLGIREGIIVACLVLFNVPLDIATGISVLSRLWFLLGELFIFIFALVLDKNLKKIFFY